MKIQLAIKSNALVLPIMQQELQKELVKKFSDNYIDTSILTRSRMLCFYVEVQYICM
jgi:hypothetical protein